jgi:periplasmic protein TonB
MQLQQTSPDAVASFSDFLLERFGLIPSMQVSFVTSIAIHLFVVIGLGIKFIDLRKWDAPHNVLDVVLVNSKSATKPTKADALAQANLDGGGNTDEKLQAKSPFPSLKEREQQEQLQQQRMKQLEREAKELMTQLKSSAQVAQAPTAPPADAKGNEQARDLVEKSLEIARLEAQIRREMQAYQERPKKKFIGARAAEYRFAVYVDNWRMKVERIGTLNYPEEAKKNRIYGSLQLTVGIKADGEVESVEINRSSKSKVLDQAAIRIVRLAAPFDRFPDNIKADTDILYITRTWTFTRGDQVLAE